LPSDHGFAQGQISPRPFIRYLFDSAKVFIQEHELTGKELWESLEHNIDLILSHPNGWEGREQGFLQKSVVQASIFTEEEALSRVSFVTEGEATFLLSYTMMKKGFRRRRFVQPRVISEGPFFTRVFVALGSSRELATA